MLVAGEASGDGHAAKLVGALRDLSPETDFEFFGCAGPRMRDGGVDAVVKADDLAIMGVPEIARALPVFLDAFKRLKTAARERKPDAVVLIDFPEFNLKLAKSLKKIGLTVVYYISPQLWGWRKYRRRTIRDHVDLLLSIVPFEKDWYAEHGIENVEYVGSPLAREVKPSVSREDFRREHAIDPQVPVIALLPGSRHKELTRILPPMLEAAALVKKRDDRCRFVLALAATRREDEVTDALKIAKRNSKFDIPAPIIVKDRTYDAVNAADAAAVASGTATLETGIIGTPMAIVYKTSGFNYRLVRPLIDVEHFGMINLIAGKRIVAELIQDDFTPVSLSEELTRLLEPKVNAEIRNELQAAVEKLGSGGASKRAAAAIFKIVTGRSKSA